MSRLAGPLLLLLLLVCGRSPSNADLIHAVDAAKHLVVPETTDAILRVADAKKPENKFARAASGADHDDRKSRNTADDDDDAAVQRQLADNKYREHDASKRKWGKYSLQAWGKRRWTAANSKAAWGKRDGSDEDGERKWRPRDLTAWNKLRQEAAAEKRRWSANNGMRAWGKRSRPYFEGRSKRSVGSRNDEVALVPYVVDHEQRQWTPVKRQWRYGGPKRKWEYNTMNSWGKRRTNWPDYLDRDDGRIWPKRSWSSDNSLRVWG